MNKNALKLGVLTDFQNTHYTVLAFGDYVMGNPTFLVTQIDRTRTRNTSNEKTNVFVMPFSITVSGNWIFTHETEVIQIPASDEDKEFFKELIA